MATIGADTLEALKQSGVDSVVLDCRLRYATANQILKHYINFLERAGARCYPTMLPTQSSGRWSTKEPPLVNVPKEYRDVVIPDPGYYWLTWDYDAIEAVLAIALSGDEAGLQAIKNNWDIHTLTACEVFKLPRPPVPTKAGIAGPECQQWRETIKWLPDDPRRQLCKVLRYATTYAPDEQGVLHAKGVETLNMTRSQLLKAAKLYLDSQPKLKAWKKRTWAEILRKREARTFLGRRRRLFPTPQEINIFSRTGRPGDAAKEGLNHLIQGGVADIMNLTIKAISERWPEATLVWNAHDSAPFSFPESVNPWPEIKDIVEREWEVMPGTKVRFTGEWKRIDSYGKKEVLI